MLKKGSIVIEFNSEVEEQRFLNWALSPSKSPAKTKAKRAMETASRIESLNVHPKPAGIVVKASSIPNLRKIFNSTAHIESTQAVARITKQDIDELLVRNKVASSKKRKRSERGRAKDAFSSSIRNKSRNHK
ncbi:hypothetical protein PDR95_06360 [Bacillus cereus]|nr:hypothetical protein [Bacillus cereus]MDA2706970.1 hypothetical protein [Bacillus cereus]